jgi:hydroxymethylbilane synthase
MTRLGSPTRASTAVSLPAIGQGAIGIECRADDQDINELLSALHDWETGLCITAERAMNARLNGGCQVPIAGFAQRRGDHLFMRGLAGSPDGRVIYRTEKSGDLAQAEAIGREIAEELLALGADKILNELFH